MFTGSMTTLAQKDISWFDWSHVGGISADGNHVLFDETGEGGGPDYSVYLYHRKGGSTERIGVGRALDLSRDGQWVVAGSRTDLSRINLISTVNAQRRTFTAPGLAYQSARFLPPGNSILVLASSSGGPLQTYVQDLNTGKMRLVKNGGSLYNATPSPDGSLMAAAQFGHRAIVVLNLSTGERQSFQVKAPAMPVVWPNAQSIVIATSDGHSVHLETLDVATGKFTLFRKLPAESVLPEELPPCFYVSADLTTFAYSQIQKSTHLFAVDGWK
jgi:Tol biopolymer transport system component